MSTTTKHHLPLSKEEWSEAKALLEAINFAPATVVPSRMERLAEYIVRSLHEKQL